MRRRFTAPGAESNDPHSSSRNALETTGFLAADGDVVVMLLNRTEEDIRFTYFWGDRKAESAIPRR